MRLSRGRLHLVGLIALVLALGAGAGLLSRAVGRAREAAYQSVCNGHLFHIMLALHNYHDVHGAFPPAHVADAQGRPMHSWRVLILPFLEYSDIYHSYNFDQPWDGPNNRALQARMPPTFACFTHRGRDAQTPFTSYVAVTGPDTIWGRPLRALKRPEDAVLMLAETTADVPWTAPFDLPAAGIATATGPPTPDLPLPASDHERGFHVSYARPRIVILGDDQRAEMAAAASLDSTPVTPPDR